MNASIINYRAILDLVTEEVKACFGGLNGAALNWKPSAEKWSIAQCLDHIMIANTTYLPQFDEIIAGKHRNTRYQNIKFLSRMFGKRLIKDTGPLVQSSFKNPPIFQPATSNLKSTIINDFEKHQQVISSYFEKLADADLENTVIYSPVTRIVIYSLQDAFTIITGHEQRHFNQAKRVMQYPNFPK